MTFYLFCRSFEIEAYILKDILDTYGKTSAQLINFQKLKFFYNSNIPYSTRHSIYALLGVTRPLARANTLGFPSIIGKIRKKVFGFIKERLRRHINHWTSKNLSKVGK